MTDDQVRDQYMLVVFVVRVVNLFKQKLRCQFVLYIKVEIDGRQRRDEIGSDSIIIEAGDGYIVWNT